MDAQPIGSKHFSAVNPSGVTQIVDPAANVSGVVVRTCAMTSPGIALLSTGAVRPTSGGDRAKPNIFGVSAGMSHLQYPVTIPAGYGLWVTTQASEAGLWLTYDLLP